MSTNDPSVPIEVDTNRANCGAWLVKMPKYLSQILNEHGNKVPNGEIGKLIRRPVAGTKGATSSTASSKTPEVTFRLSDAIIERVRNSSQNSESQMPQREHRFL